jgi:hypothetical protein
LSFKEFDQSTDISSQLSSINEIIPLTGTLFSGTEAYTKTYLNITSGSALSGGFFETIYDGAPTSVSSSALIDLTWGFSSASLLQSYAETFLKNEKGRVYKQMAKLLLGSEDAIFQFGGASYHEVVFLLPKRRIYKDEIKKGNTSITLQMTGTNGVDGDSYSLADTGAQSTFVVGPAGDEADLFSGSTAVGKVYYNAGIVAYCTGAHVPQGLATNHSPHWSGSAANAPMNRVAISGNIDNFVYGLKNHLNQVQFHNQTNLHSTIYFCRALNSEFNYSTNPTFVDGDGRIIVTSGTDNQTRTYITTIGLYDINDNLLAVAKTSEPVKKSPDSELIFRVRLSY